jgi:rhodanese-related sulfurtransferase
MLKGFAATLLIGFLLAVPGTLWAKDGASVNNISALKALDLMRNGTKNVFVVDVRTRAEYWLVGHPPQAYNVPWRFFTTDFAVKDQAYLDDKALYTGYQVSAESNPDFLSVVQSLFKPDDHLVIISNHGTEGAKAAESLVGAGYKNVYNVEHGLWGDPPMDKDEAELVEKYSPHFDRGGRVNGWIYWGLPLTRRIDARYVYPPDIKRMQESK